MHKQGGPAARPIDNFACGIVAGYTGLSGRSDSAECKVVASAADAAAPLMRSFGVVEALDP